MILGILGGMGPMSTYDFLKKIIDNTEAKTDQEHLHIIIDNNTKIPDRTEHIEGKGQDPRYEMIRSAMKLEMMGADYMVIACNTAHYYYEDIVKYVDIPVIHMIRELGQYLKKRFPGHGEYLLLATEGTYKSQIYKNILEEYDIRIIEPNEMDKREIMNWIYGLKSSTINTGREEFSNLIARYGKEDRPVILGCTELPILARELNIENEIYIDPTLVLARRCIELANIQVDNSHRVRGDNLVRKCF